MIQATAINDYISRPKARLDRTIFVRALSFSQWHCTQIGANFGGKRKLANYQSGPIKIFGRDRRRTAHNTGNKEK